MFILPRSRECLCFVAFLLAVQTDGQYLGVRLKCESFEMERKDFVAIVGNDSCAHPSGEPARCTPKSQCQEVTILLSHGVNPIPCRGGDNEDFVCCKGITASAPHVLLVPNKVCNCNQTSTLKMEVHWTTKIFILEFTACAKFKRLTPAVSLNPQGLLLNPVKEDVRVNVCSKSSAPFIINGENASPGEFPHMALLGYLNNNETLWACGGSLISEYFVLTAAHCTVTVYGGPVVVRLGEHSLRSPDMEMHLDFTIGDTIVHDEYNCFQFYNDIALLRLKDRVFFNDFIRPACLPPENLTFSSAIATGWGLTDGFSDEKSDTLQKVVLKPKPISLCRKEYRALADTKKLFMGIQSSSQLCYGEEGGKDSSQGDSGGPLQVVDDSCNYYIVGITSFGKTFGNRTTFGVYTRVQHYLDWIENVVWPDLSAVPIIF